MWDHSYCRVPFWESRNNSDFLECKLPPQSFQRIVLSNQDLLFVETGSIEPSSRCLPTKLVPQESLCFSPILHDPKGFEQSPDRQSTYDDPCNYSLAIRILVPRSNENVHT